uniref:Uncharacterized protein n=1 Tax=Arion vulgaris TaxID=1028688 RepID=A0A0B7AMV3_9EUPU
MSMWPRTSPKKDCLLSSVFWYVCGVLRRMFSVGLGAPLRRIYDVDPMCTKTLMCFYSVQVSAGMS